MYVHISLVVASISTSGLSRLLVENEVVGKPPTGLLRSRSLPRDGHKTSRPGLTGLGVPEPEQRVAVWSGKRR